MELEFTGEQDELRSSVRSFLDRECPLQLVRGVVESTRDARQALGLHGRARLARPGPTRGVRRHGTLLRGDRGGGRGARPGHRAWACAAHLDPVRSRSSARSARLSSGRGSSRGRRWCGHRHHGARGSPPRLGTRQAHHGRRACRGGLGPRRHQVRGPRRCRDGRGGCHRPADDGLGAFLVPACDAGLTPVHSLDASRPLATVTLNACSSPTSVRWGIPAAWLPPPESRAPFRRRPSRWRSRPSAPATRSSRWCCPT